MGKLGRLGHRLKQHHVHARDEGETLATCPLLRLFMKEANVLKQIKSTIMKVMGLLVGQVEGHNLARMQKLACR